MDLAKLIDGYNALGIADVVDHENFKLISITAVAIRLEASIFFKNVMRISAVEARSLRNV
jgi:hypothetical protein